jgi:hypothetical protein
LQIFEINVVTTMAGCAQLLDRDMFANFGVGCIFEFLLRKQDHRPY